MVSTSAKNINSIDFFSLTIYSTILTNFQVHIFFKAYFELVFIDVLNAKLLITQVLTFVVKYFNKSKEATGDKLG